LAGNYLGTVTLEGRLIGPLVVTDGAGTPTDPAVLPTFRVYGSLPGLMPNGTGNAQRLDTGAVSGASNASPIVISSTAHGLNTGTRVSISAVAGNTAANTSSTITKVDADHFSLDGTTGNGAYTSGGAWHVSGLYTVEVLASAGDGYESGETYWVLVSWTISGVAYAGLFPFTVI
jgi:hypothetical protein